MVLTANNVNNVETTEAPHVIHVDLIASKVAGTYLLLSEACDTALANVLFAIMNEQAIY